MPSFMVHQKTNSSQDLKKQTTNSAAAAVSFFLLYNYGWCQHLTKPHTRKLFSLSSKLMGSVMTRDGGNAPSGQAEEVSTHLVFPALLSACFETDEEMEKIAAFYTKCWTSRMNYIFGQGAVKLNGLKTTCWGRNQFCCIRRHHVTCNCQCP